MKCTLDWCNAAAIRMLRTADQVALGMITVGMTVSEVDWLNVLSVSLVAAVYSLLTSIITDLPETGTDGEVHILPNGEVTGIDVDLTNEELLKKGRVKLVVNGAPDAEPKVYTGKH